MRVLRVFETYQDIRRYGQISSVFVRYGFGELLDRLRVDIMPARRRLIKQQRGELRRFSTAERLRMAFEELGPTFVKLAQILSTRSDLLTPEFVEELSKLQDRASPFPFADARILIEADLGRPLSDAFRSVEARPVAAASLAQVHRAVTPAGDEVAIKVQRPDVGTTIETDIRILRDMAGLAERHIAEGRRYQPVRLVDEFARTIRRELDFVREGRNIDRFRRYCAGDESVYIPRVHWDLTGARVLTTEYIRGIKISDLQALDEAGLDRRTIAVNGASLTLKEIFDYHFFHADPHPGNLFVLENNVIAPVDFGMTGSLTEDIAEHMAVIFVAIVNRDADSLVGALQSVGWVQEILDEQGLKLELRDLLERYYRVPLQQLDIASMMGEVMDIVRRYDLRLPPELMLTARAILVSEGVGRMLYPEFNIIEYAKPHAKRLMLREFDPVRQLRELHKLGGEAASLFRRLPSEMGRLLSKVMRGDLSIRFIHQGLEDVINELERSTNRLSFAIVIAALIIGSSLIFQSGLGPSVAGYPLIGLIGFLLASILGVWLLIGILRSGML